ncbi:hypothetical protein ACNQFZ_12100 [Schinkia sp. CFF1]
MQKYTYSPPKIKDSTKLIDVMDEQGNVKCRFKRTYKNLLVRLINYLGSFDWYTQIDVYSNNGELIYHCKKTAKWVGHPYYHIFNCKTNEIFQVTYKTWQKIAPEFLITSPSHEFTMKKEVMDWARLYHQGKEVARWKMKTTEWFKTYLEIEETSPIQDPEFFICLFQCIFYVGD